MDESDWTDMAYISNTSMFCQAIEDGNANFVHTWFKNLGMNQIPGVGQDVHQYPLLAVRAKIDVLIPFHSSTWRSSARAPGSSNCGSAVRQGS